jgi:uncharacterized protein involved in exopolysaccharide biosynthesis
MFFKPVRSLGTGDSSVPAVQEVAAMVSRQRKIALAVGAAIFFFAVIYGLLLTDRYEARMEILVEQQQLRRADPVVTGDANAQPIVNQETSTSDETLNSEIALLRSQNVLRQVVTSCGLDAQAGVYYSAVENLWWAADRLHASRVLSKVAVVIPFLRRPTEEQLIEKAMGRLAGKLEIEIIKLSDVITVSYRSSNPQQAAHVLQVLGNVYLSEHALARYPHGEVEFFQKQTEQARANLIQDEQQLVKFTQAGGVANGETQLQDALKRLSDATAAQDQVRAQISATTRRIGELQEQASSIPARQTTVLKSADSAVLLQQLKSQLLDLEMKRTQLLTQYQPEYPLVTEVNQQIAQAQTALRDAEKSQVEERTTDRDPNYELVREELTRGRVELAGLRAQAASLASEYATDDHEVRWLQQQMMQQQDLIRQEKTAEDNYLLLLHKQQEAQVSEALDKRGIFNVSVVQTASVPALPVHPASWYVMYGALLSILAAFAAAVGADRLDPTLRTPEEVEAALRAPVLVVMPLLPDGPPILDEKVLPVPNRSILKLT